MLFRHSWPSTRATRKPLASQPAPMTTATSDVESDAVNRWIPVASQRRAHFELPSGLCVDSPFWNHHIFINGFHSKTYSEEEQKILRELMLESRCAFRPDERTNAKGSTRKSARRKTHTVPATSKYPMYDQILADQEKRFGSHSRASVSV